MDPKELFPTISEDPTEEEYKALFHAMLETDPVTSNIMLRTNNPEIQPIVQAIQAKVFPLLFHPNPVIRAITLDFLNYSDKSVIPYVEDILRTDPDLFLRKMAYGKLASYYSREQQGKREDNLMQLKEIAFNIPQLQAFVLESWVDQDITQEGKDRLRRLALKGLESPIFEVRDKAIERYVSLIDRNGSEKYRDEIFNKLTSFLADPDEKFREIASYYIPGGLIKIMPLTEVVKVFKTYDPFKYPTLSKIMPSFIRLNAGENKRSKEIVDLLLELTTNKYPNETRAEAVYHLIFCCSVYDREVQQRYLELIEDDNDEVRYNAMWGLGLILDLIMFNIRYWGATYTGFKEEQEQTQPAN